MKKLLLPLLTVLLLAGCQRIYPDEFLYVNEHEAPFAYRETETTDADSPGTKTPKKLTTVSRASDIREAIQDLVMNGEETGEFILVDYTDDIEKDMKNMYSDLLSDSPKYTYAMDSFEWSMSEGGIDRTVSVRMKLRLTPQEVQAIPTRRFPEPAMTEIKEALLQQVSTYTVQVSGYRDIDLDAVLEDFILEHPDQIVEPPGVSVSVYPPDRGSVRILELHFVYSADRDTLLQRKMDVNVFLELVFSQLNRNQSPQEIVEILFDGLIPSANYSFDPEATVYSLAVHKTGNSRIVSSVAAYLCNRLGVQCEVVVGKRSGKPWCWNRIMCDGGWRYFDLSAGAETGRCPALASAKAMTGYSWDRDRYPEVTVPEAIAPVEPEPSAEPTEATESVEASLEEPTETFSSTAPESTGPVVSTESGQASSSSDETP